MSRRPIVFAVVTVIVAGAAWSISQQRAPQREVGTPPLYPALSNKINEVARMEVKSQSGEVALVRDGGGWVIENRDRYPARFEEIKRAIIHIAELKILEPKTRLPDMYSHIGVEDISAPQSKSSQVTMKDASGQALASLLIGKERTTGGASEPARYVRKAGEEQAYLVEGDLQVSADPMDWAERELLSVEADRIREVTIEHPGQSTVTLRREKPADVDLELQGIPEGHKTRSAATATSLASALEALRFDDVRASDAVAWPAESTVTTLRGFNGLVAVVRTAKIDDRQYSRLEFSFDPAGVTAAADAQPKPEDEPPVIPVGEATPPAVRKEQAEVPVADEVKALNERVQNWIYVLPEFKRSMLTKTMEDLIAKQEAPKPPPAAPVDPLTVERFDSEGNPLPSDALVPIDPGVAVPPIEQQP